MSTVLETLTYVSEILGDQEMGREFRTYTKDELKARMREAFHAIAARMPDLLAHQTSMTLVEGKMQASPCGGGIVRIYDADEVNADQIRDGGESVLFANCGDGTYQISQYSTLPGNANFIVRPPVPAGTSPVINITCTGSVSPELRTLDDITDLSALPADVREIVIDWILYRSYLVDDADSATNVEADRIYNRLSQRLGDEFVIAERKRREMEDKR